MLKFFIRDISGNFSAMGAFVMLALMGGIGLAVDYTEMTNVSARLQSATDNAVLRAAQANSSNEAESIRIGDESFLSVEASDGAVTRQYDFQAGRVSLISQLEYKPLIMGILGFGTQTISVSSSASKADLGRMDVALVLDVTASMKGTKIIDLKNAVNRFIDLIESTNADVRVSIVPYNNYVNVNTTGTAPSWVDNSLEFTNFPSSAKTGTGATFSPQRRWDGCVGSRTGFNALVPEYGASKFHAVYDDGNQGAAYDYTKYGCPVSILPLTANMNTVRNKVNGLIAKGRTYIPGGLMWGWRTLDPRLPYEHTVSDPARRQILVLMTDGGNSVFQSNATPYHGGQYHNLDTKELPRSQVTIPAEARMREVCDNIKSMTDITVFSIAFDIDDQDVLAPIRECASSPTFFFEAGNGAVLRDTFRTVGERVAKVRLLN